MKEIKLNRIIDVDYDYEDKIISYRKKRSRLMRILFGAPKLQKDTRSVRVNRSVICRDLYVNVDSIQYMEPIDRVWVGVYLHTPCVRLSVNGNEMHVTNTIKEIRLMLRGKK